MVLGWVPCSAVQSVRNQCSNRMNHPSCGPASYRFRLTLGQYICGREDEFRCHFALIAMANRELKKRKDKAYPFCFQLAPPFRVNVCRPCRGGKNGRKKEENGKRAENSRRVEFLLLGYRKVANPRAYNGSVQAPCIVVCVRTGASVCVNSTLGA